MNKAYLRSETDSVGSESAKSGEDFNSSLIIVDENLLEKSRSQWQFGDWDSLSQLDCDALRQHPDRANIALLVAAGKLQIGRVSEARDLLILARDWGCNKRLMIKIVAAGVYNSLGRAYLLTKNDDKSVKSFESSLIIGMPYVDIKLATKARMSKQSLLLGEAANWSFIAAADLDNSIAGPEIIEHWREQAIEISRYKALFSYLVRKDFLSSAAGGGSQSGVMDSPLGDSENYYIKSGYKSRDSYFHYDDMQEEDKWQLEVYLHAYSIMKKNGFTKAVDFGCGSGFKLINYLGEFETIGYELIDNVVKLREKYPGRRWEESVFSDNLLIDADVIVCSDVIEHLVDPNELLRFFLNQKFHYIIFSTPDRNIVRGFEDCGPPKNSAHVREWSYIEFRKYISDWFCIVDHRVTNIEQGTQMIVCRRK